MKRIAPALFAALIAASCLAGQSTELSAERIKSLVTTVNDASNRMMMVDATTADVDNLFTLYADDFVYVHEVYGGTYPREQLYKNSINNMKAGRYKMKEPRYKILNIIPGLNAAAVERLELASGKTHLTVFEFKGEKVSKTTEYWK